MKDSEEESAYLKVVEDRLSDKVNKMREKISQWKKKIKEDKEFLWDNSSDMDEEERLENKQSTEEEILLLDAYMKYQEQLSKLLPSPYFGKIRFSIGKEELPVYIGINGFYEKESDTSYIYDWRAPISSVYYEYEVGPASYQAPDGRIEGSVLEKKQFQIRDGKIKYMVDTNFRIDDEVLLQQLSKNAKGHMKQVAATIQKEQNAIIRDDKSKTLIINGCAGSGKTIIALHRIAWLLYNHRKRLRSDNVMVLSPNGLFSDYICEVLPELGEENVVTKEWDDLMADMLLVTDPYEYKNDQIHYILSCEDESDERYQRICYKTSIPFFKQLNEFIAGKKLISEGQVIALYLSFLKQLEKIKPGIYQYLNDADEICYEDIIAVFYMQVKLLGVGTLPGVRHLLIDEMQDYNIFQYAIIKEIFECKMTILGDEHQALLPHNKISESLALSFPEEKILDLNVSYRSTAEITEFANGILDKEYAKSVKRHGPAPFVVSEEDETVLKEKIIWYLDQIKQKNYETIAILCEDANECYKWFDKLQEDATITLIKETTTRDPGGIMIMPAYLSKGLEFDVVIIINTNESGIPAVRRQMLYIEATRALHELAVFHTENMGDYLPNWIK